MGYEHAQSQRHAGSVSECFWGWRGVPQVLGIQLWRYHSQYDASAVTGKAQGQREILNYIKLDTQKIQKNNGKTWTKVYGKCKKHFEN